MFPYRDGHEMLITDMYEHQTDMFHSIQILDCVVHLVTILLCTYLPSRYL